MRHKFRLTALCCAFLLTAGCGQQTGDSIRFSWWGGESRHQATLAAVQGFEAANPGTTVHCEYGAWSGWEDAAAAALYAGTEPDVMQVNFNWLTDYSSDTAGFADLRGYADILDLTQYDPDVLEMCTVDGKLLCLPISETGRVFLWNETTFAKAGLEIPRSFAELTAAGEIFRDTLGAECYPLALGWYDRMLFLVYVLQCRHGREWMADGQLQYTREEIEAGLALIQQMEDGHVIPPLKQIAGGGADSFDKDEAFITGRYAGIYEWDSSAGKFVDALAVGQTLVVGDYFADLGDYRGGFSKIAQGFAVSKHAQNPELAARLIAYLTADPAAVTILGTERGVPLNHRAYEICASAGLFGDIAADAYDRMNDWVTLRIDPAFENAALKGVSGVYEDVFTGMSYGVYSVSQAADRLCAGIQTALAGEIP